MKSRLLAALLCLCLLCATLPCAVTAEEKQTGTVAGLNEGVPLRVRSKPVDGDVVDQLYNDDVVTILSVSEDKAWYQIITPNGVTGWSSASFIQINEPKPTDPPAEPPADTPIGENTTGTVHKLSDGSKLYVREKASTGAKVLDKLSNGDVVKILAISEDKAWYQVVTPANVTGWCNASYVRINKSYETEEDFEAYLTAQGFPESYKPALRILHAHYPTWVFEAQQLSMTWAEALAAETEVLKNSLNINEYPEAWLSMEYGAYNWKTGKYVEMDSGGWVTPTVEITAYFMDPRNFLDFTYIFQFENLLYSDKHTTAGVQSILSSKHDGYAADLLQAAKEANVNAYFLATRMAQEGSKVDGTYVGDDGVSYAGYYNFFNMGSYAGSQHGSYHGANTNGAIYAKKQGWDSPYKCILGSAQILGKNYIHKNQNTTYFQKFNVAGANLYNHQYMSNINAPTAESKIRSKNATAEELANGVSFVIPVYKDMPEKAAVKPSEKGNNNNFLDSLTVDGFALSPTFNRYTLDYAAEVTKETTEVTITAVANNDQATVKGTGTIQLYAGENLLPITVTATSGAVRTYTISVFCEADNVPEKPEEPTTTTGTGSTTSTGTNSSTGTTGSGTTVSTTTGTTGSTTVTTATSTTVTTTAKPTTTTTTTTAPAKPTVSCTAYKIGNAITGVEPQTAVADFIAKLTVKNGTIKIVDVDGTEKKEGFVATGDTLKVLNKDGKEFQTIPVLIYGDANGDGKITSQDLRRIQRHILAAATLEGQPLAAADANKDGNVTSQDLRRIQRYILGAIDSLNKEG